MKVEMKLQGIDGVLGVLQSLPAEVVSKRGGPVKLALAKGARALRDKARQNLQRSIDIRGSDSTGTTVKSVIASRGKAPTGTKGERQLVRVKKKAFINAHGKRTSTLMTANLLEYGSAHQPATPWLRPSVATHAPMVIDTITADLIAQIDKAVKRLAKPA
ncbi:hypothetical protein [Xanthomonas cannabis]|uniref:hypothetical protein n=1 Tax=Xanthomonas cannabis TaxID=1885674 RepID=UPI00141BE31B|nr:hypothetical protein [Xanthomonas cannabis]NIK17395.1 hypothetical protein [Xanthomonas cannabis]